MEIIRRGDLGLGSVTSDDGGVELGRRNEGGKYLLAEGACGLIKKSEVVARDKTIRRTPTWMIFLNAITVWRGEVGRVLVVDLVVYLVLLLRWFYWV